MVSNRKLTSENQQESARLKAIWESRRKILDIDQNELAEQLETTQGYISQCFNGHVAINTDMLINFASALKFNPQDVRPNVFKGLPIAQSCEVLVANDTRNKKPRIKSVQLHTTTPLKGEMFAVQVRGDVLAPRALDNEFVIVEVRKAKIREEVLISLTSGVYALGTLQAQGKDGIAVDTFHDGPIEVPLDYLHYVHPVVSIQKQ